MNSKIKNIGYSKYPIKSVVLYNAVTILHYFLGFIGILYAMEYSFTAKIIAVIYLSYAFIQMYILMPVMVCPNCVYVKKPNMLCISGLNKIAGIISPEGDIKNFKTRGDGLFCHNNLYLAAKVLPLIIILPFLIINYSFTLLIIFITVLGLLLFRIFFIFTKIACNHCLAKNICPNAKSLGLSEV